MLAEQPRCPDPETEQLHRASTKCQRVPSEGTQGTPDTAPNACGGGDQHAGQRCPSVGAVIGASATRAPGPHLPACPHKEAGSGYAVPRHAAPGLSVPAPRTQDCLSPSLPFPLRTPQAWERASGAAAECHLGVAQGGITVLRANTRHRRLCSGPPPGVAPPPPQPPHCCCGVPPPPLLLPPCGHQSER
ncbi:WAS/WASL-interacting protein family member 3-like isoform X2 [Phyllostomus hastatus]|uniref:WAS/WASL-interacting protein family member 3-like isoform X2 n=1 Tax=Phyllostomus hastatus TaxID=9423 RepID=UPI001E68134B|nr:WAS/WASL-interacting protein family member 3-like isoform X2 [Phyllostomus hastatus]